VKRVFGLVFVFTAASFFAGAPGHFTSAPADAASAKATAKPAAKHTAAKPTKLTMADLAPADEYFGPMKLSILGIRNTIRDLGLKYDADPSKGDATIASAAFAEKAIRDWQKRYPRDTQLPRNIYFLEHLYAKIQTPQGSQKTYATETWLFTAYGTSAQARQLRREIAAAKNAPPPTAAVTSTPSNVQPGSSVDQPQNPNVALPTPAPAAPQK
jgi:hypothetical protein